MPRASSAAEGARPGSISHCTRTPLTSAWCSEPIARVVPRRRHGGRIEYDYHDTAQQQKILAGAFEGVGWHVPDLLGQMPAATDFYFDSVSQVRLDRWSSGRVALIGDAGYAAGPGGNGTGTAVAAAYVLAGSWPRPAATTVPRSPAASTRSAATSRGARSRPSAAGTSSPRPPRRRSGSATGSSGCRPTCRPRA
ncbi:MAG: hypothetical protein ACRDPF_05745 [Streptosporangiaceae bacterium]